MAGFHKENTAESQTMQKLGKAGSINSGKLDLGQGSTGTSPPCPECGSNRIWKDGMRETRNGPAQRFLCRDCGYRFTDPRLKQPQKPLKALETAGKNEKASRNKLKNPAGLLYNRRVCDDPFGEAFTGRAWLVQNLAEVENPAKSGLAGATETFKGKIVEFLWKLKKDGRKLNTIQCYGRMLHDMVREGVNLCDPEEVKGYIAKKPWKESTKLMYTVVLRNFLKYLKIPWEPPKYTAQQEIPFIPTERELDQLIAAAGKKLGAFLQLLKETGARSGEIAKLTWEDVDFEQKTIRIRPEKGSLPRILPISSTTIERLKRLPRTGSRIFSSIISLRSNFNEQRRRIARKLANPRIMQIHFHTFRHWKATMEYHKTKDIIHVMQLLGHKNIKNTLIYINIEKALFPAGASQDFHVKTARTPEQIQELLEAGFEYVLEKDGIAFFRKRK